ncbi:MAG: hypothetical protein IKU70_09695 [Clostridia bacterium]|nr:hypothetical protein [Clostridia bacterium]
MRHPFEVSEKRFDAGKWLMLALLFVLSFAMFYQMTLIPSSDISIHATWAAEGDFRDLTSFVHHGIHPLWHVIVSILLHLGVSLPFASALVTALSKVFVAYVTHRLLTVALHGKLSRTSITLMTSVLMLVSCVCIPSYNPTVYLGVGTPNTWHSCTQMLALAFMVVCVPYTAWCYDIFEERLAKDGELTILPWKQALLLGALLFMSLLAKPSFMQAFLPACCLYFLVQWIRHPKNSRYFLQVLLCVMPAILFMIFQYLFYFADTFFQQDAGMVLELSWSKALSTGIRVLLMMAFPLYTLVVCRRQKADTSFVITLLFTLVAIAEMLFLGEDGIRAQDGNFGWGVMGASLMLWIICMIRFLKADAVQKWSKPQNLLGWLLIAWHLVSGVYYIGYLFFTRASL